MNNYYAIMIIQTVSRKKTFLKLSYEKANRKMSVKLTPRHWHGDWRKWRPAEMTSCPWKFQTSRPCDDHVRRKLVANHDIRLWTDFLADLEVIND